MLLIKNVFLPLESDFSNPAKLLAKTAKISLNEILSAKLYRKSVDARHKNNIVFCCSFLTELKNEKTVIKRNKNAEVYIAENYIWKCAESEIRPIVVGFGPAGMFAGLVLSRAGLKPIIIERGESAEGRKKSVEKFFNGGELNTESNIQFGEGGAGTFSDGKLNTGTKDKRIRVVLEEFVKFGAPEKILYDAKPHIGTDILINIVQNIRNEIISLGGEVRFNTRLENLNIADNKITGIQLSNGEAINTNNIILAIGHSARDTFKMIFDNGLTLTKKPFSVGARIEHRQKDINNALYGDFANNTALGSADYKMAVHLENGRGVYTFCMCPGGEVVNASSEKGGIAVNGMSLNARNGENANSALLVEVYPEDLPDTDIFAGIEFQREIEKRAFTAADGFVPFCTVGDLSGIDNACGHVLPTVKPKAVKTDINSVLPEFIVDSLKSAMPLFGKKIKGFDNPNAILTFPETRSTSPIRINRDEAFCAVGFKGIYPAGEGAGYAGGIMSAAVDGMKCAEAIIEAVNNGKQA